MKKALLAVVFLSRAAVAGAQTAYTVLHNFALTHASCNQNKGVSDLRVARRMAEFERLQQQALEQGERGANLGHVLAKYGGAKEAIRFKKTDSRVEFTLSAVGDESIQSVPLYHDPLSDMSYFFGVFPLDYIHHDDRINPRPIGSNIRALIEEFLRKRPQLHVGLAWWVPEKDGAGKIKIFDLFAKIHLGGGGYSPGSSSVRNLV